MTTFIRENIIILALILILGLYLGAKSFGDGWDGWGFGSAQTLMSGEYWAKDGFARNYFLFIPRPYSKIVKYFDEPEFRNRPIETLNGELNRYRIYYTHYPPLYLAPYAIFSKIGIENRVIFRIFSVVVSLVALFLFYIFIKSISNKLVALVASVYYGLSVTFLNYADSISIQPWTILFTFLIFNLSILAWKNFDKQEKYKKYAAAIWFSYLALSLSSYDATFFVFAYLILFDVFILKKFLWKKWLLFALAPILGFALQVLQNIWYLGASETWQDIYNSYTGRAIGSLKGFILGLMAPFISMTSFKTFLFFKKSFLTLFSVGLILVILWEVKEKLNNSIFFKLIFVLAASAIIQPLLINVTGHWPYQGVLTAPFWGLLVGMASTFLFKQKNSLKNKSKKFLFLILALVLIGIWLARFYDTFKYANDWPNNKPPIQVIEFSKEIKKLYPNKEKIAFRVIPENSIWKSQFPTFNFEYYLGMPKIDFANAKDLLVDFEWLKNHSEYPFYSFLIAENESDIQKIHNEVKKTFRNSTSKIINIQNQYIFTVGPK